MEKQAETPKKSSNRSLGFFIALFIISLALNFFLFFKYAKNGAYLEKENKKLSSLLEQSTLHSDSLQKELDFLIAELENKINENLAMNDIKDDYRLQLEQKLVELKSAKQQISGLIASSGSQSGSSAYSTLAEAQREIENLQTSNATYIQQLNETQRLYAIARNAVDQYSISSQEYEQAVDSLVTLYQALNASVAEARVLKIDDFNITPMLVKKDKSEPTYKASKVQQIKISFNMSESTLVQPGEKDIIIRITGTSGEVLSDHVDQLTNSDELYSMSQEFDYSGKEQFVVLYYTQKARYKTGKHIVQLILEGETIETKEFILY